MRHGVIVYRVVCMGSFLLTGGKIGVIFLDPYADPYGKWTVWTQSFRVVSDLRDFLGKGAKPPASQRKIQLLAAHNPEVVGSSPASATKELLKSQDFRSSSFLSGSKSWVFFRESPPDPYRDPYQKMSNRITSPWDRPSTTPGLFVYCVLIVSL